MPASEFMLKTSEFDAILSWIKTHTPGAGVHQCSVMGRLEYQDMLEQKRAEALETHAWSEYVGSREFEALRLESTDKSA